MLQSQDIVVCLKALRLPQWPGYTMLAESVGLSVSQAHRSVQRLMAGRLFVEVEMRVHRENLARFLTHGLPHVFPARLGELVRGVPTAWACPALNSPFFKSLASDDPPPVWGDKEGILRGRAVEPLHGNISHATKGDSELYALLALIDTLRVGRAREREVAEKELVERIHHAGG